MRGCLGNPGDPRFVFGFERGFCRLWLINKKECLQAEGCTLPVGPTLRMIFAEYGELFFGRGLPAFLLVICLTAWVISRNRILERQMIGLNRRSLMAEVLENLAAGSIGGFLGALVFVFLGISVDLTSSAITALWAAVIILVMVDLRFVCVSYAGGIVALLHLLTGWPQVNVAGLMALVAVLHGVEALLIILSGARGAIPIYLKQQNQEQLIGGFSLHKIWPIAAVIIMGQRSAGPGLLAAPAPGWWPLIKSDLVPAPGNALTYMMLPLMVVLAYSDLTVTMRPGAKARRSGGLLALYSAILLAISILAGVSKSMGTFFSFLAAIFGTLGHEWVMVVSRRFETERQPIYQASSAGLAVLDVIDGSPADKMCITSGDVLTSINGRLVRTRQDLAEVLAQKPLLLHVSLIGKGGEERHGEYSGSFNYFGIIPVPGPGDQVFVEIRRGGLLRKLVDWLREGKGAGGGLAAKGEVDCPSGKE